MVASASRRSACFSRPGIFTLVSIVCVAIQCMYFASLIAIVDIEQKDIHPKEASSRSSRLDNQLTDSANSLRMISTEEQLETTSKSPSNVVESKSLRSREFEPESMTKAIKTKPARTVATTKVHPKSSKGSKPSKTSSDTKLRETLETSSGMKSFKTGGASSDAKSHDTLESSSDKKLHETSETSSGTKSHDTSSDTKLRETSETPSGTKFHELFKLSTPPYTTKFPTATRGNVMSMHNAMVPIGVSLIQELRQLGNNDPIQVMHCFRSELSAANQEIILSIDQDVEVIDACQLFVDIELLTTKAAMDFQNFWLKPLAVILSTFDQVMLMDVDNIFLHDPSELWNSKIVVDTGALFFHDRVLNFNFWLNEEIGNGKTYLTKFLETFPYQELKLSPYTGPSQVLQKSEVYARHTAHEQDSSVVLMTKSRAGASVLNVLWYLATYKRYHGNSFSWGDKESFWLSYELAHVPYRFTPWAASVVSRSDDMISHPNTLCGSLAQYHPSTSDEKDGSLFFVNGGEVIDIAESIKTPTNASTWIALGQEFISKIPQYVTPRHKRHETKAIGERGTMHQTCLLNEGAKAIDTTFQTIATTRIKNVVAIARRMTWT